MRLRRERDEALEARDDAIRERDEARAGCSTMGQWLDVVLIQRRDVRAERDRYREALERIAACHRARHDAQGGLAPPAGGRMMRDFTVYECPEHGVVEPHEDFPGQCEHPHCGLGITPVPVEVEALRRERDEARAEAARYREALERLTVAANNYWGLPFTPAVKSDPVEDQERYEKADNELDKALDFAREALGGDK